MFDRISIRSKLIAIVAAPLAVIIALAAVGFFQRQGEAADTRADVRRLETIDATQLLQYELQREALYSVTFIASGGERGRTALDAQRTRTDGAAAGLERAMGDLAGDENGLDSARSALRQIQSSDDTLRTQVDERTLDWLWALELFRQIEAALPLVGDRLAGSIEDTALAEGARSVTSLGEYSSWRARTGALLAGAVEAGGFPEETAGVDLKALFDQSVDSGETQLAVVGAESGPSTRVRLRNQMAGNDLSYFSDQVEIVHNLPESAFELTIPPERWTRAVVATLGQLREISVSEAVLGLAAAQERVSAAEGSARLYLAGALVAVLLALGLAIVVAASIARPVRQLTVAADRVATEQLPRLVEAMTNPAEDDLDHLRQGIDQLEVKGGVELARLTASVNAIQEVAVDVATEQATMLRKGIGDMFVNLARRNQGLLDRQLAYIDDLEAQEEDPDQLQHLFQLDHMATRMRRNAESLLVLAGAEPTRRRGQPVPLSKVTLAAVGEIEHFARVDLLDLDDADLVSNAAADIAHLLSELMENATQFSPPEARVEVVGHRGAEGYTLAISDHGIGMTAEQMAEANQLLARPPLLGLTLARSLGFIVVSRLAARHGISVRLVPSPTGGVTALVTVPSPIIVVGDEEQPGGLPDEVPASQPGVSSILPPLVIGGPEVEIEPWDAAPARAPQPATLEEAVPTGRAFSAGLDQVAGDADVVPLARRGSSSPTGPVPHVPVPDLTAPPGALPTRRMTPAPAAPAPASPAAPITPVAPAPVAPAPPHRPVAAPTAPVTARTAPIPPVDAPEPLPDGLVGPPLASFGAPAAPTTTSAPPRLFGDGTPRPANGQHPLGTPDGAPPAAPGAPSAVAAPPELTAAGLVRRVPRRAGATRAVPGGDGGRGGATTSSRSPDEVRSMLSRFQSGRQAGQAPAPVTGPGSPFPTADEKDT